MIPADDIPALPRDRLDQINAELQQEAEERRAEEADEMLEGVIRFAPKECAVRYLPGEETV